jgi:uncharacterized membrane protein
MAGKAALQVPFSSCIHGPCLKHICETTESRPLVSVTGAGLDPNRAIDLLGSFASGDPDRTPEPGIRANETPQLSQRRESSMGETGITPGHLDSIAPLANTATGVLCTAGESRSVRSGAYCDLLPILFINRQNELERVSTQIEAFVKSDLDVGRLNKIHGWLWMVGRPQAAHPLHRQLMRKRAIIVTEQMDLHLTWNDSYLYVKPLPAYLLCTEFWKDYLCEDSELYEIACGFLLSYSWLICYNSDYLIATKGDENPCLIPPTITWNQWRSFIEELLGRLDLGHSKTKINRRYEYGELRLARLNQIYRYAPLWWYRHLIRGYQYGYHQYAPFFSRNFAWLIVVFAYINVVLTAMLVAMGIDGFKYDSRLISASYGFSIFSMILVVVVISIAVLIFFVLFTFNLITTLMAQRKRTREKAKNKVEIKNC